MPDVNDELPRVTGFLRELSDPSHLNAVRLPSDPTSHCWCKSGRSWENCHKDREKQKPVPWGQQSFHMLSHYRAGPCLHPEASPSTCSGTAAIRSHTVQRNGGLSAIADNHHVLSIKRGFVEIDKTDGVVEPLKIGVQDASTFPGFCNIHDTTTFRPLESRDAVLNEENVFLLSLRALAYEHAAKRAAPADRARASDEMDRGLPFEGQVAIQNYLYFLYMHLDAAAERVAECWEVYGRAYLTKDTSRFRYAAFAFDDVLPFVAAGVLLPDYDFSGSRVRDVTDINALSEHLSVNVTVLGGRTVATFGWLGDESGSSRRFVTSFAELSRTKQADAMLSLVSTHIENVFFSPTWWKELSQDAREALHRKMAGLGVRPRRPDDLAPFAQGLLGSVVTDIISSKGRARS